MFSTQIKPGCNHNEFNQENSVNKIKCSTCPTSLQKSPVSNITSITSDEVIECLISAKISNSSPNCLIIDTRESFQFENGHIVSALNFNCATKMMAKRSVNNWTNIFENGLARLDYNQGFTQAPNRALFGFILIYDSNTEILKISEGEFDSPLHYFTKALISNGNNLLFIKGGYSSFLKATNAIEFIDKSSTSYQLSNLDKVSRVYLNMPKNKPYKIDWNTPIDHNERTEEKNSMSSCDRTRLNRSKLNPLPLINFQEDINQIKPNYQASCTDIWNASISKILPFLYLGNLKDAQNERLLESLKVTHIINVTNSEPMSSFGDKFKCLRLSATDNVEQDLQPAFEKAYNFINNAKKNNGIVFIHCQAGVSRSVAVVVAYLIRKNRHFSVCDALTYVQSRRSIAGPNLHFMGQLEAYWKDIHEPGENFEGRHQLRKASLDSLTANIDENNEEDSLINYLNFSPSSNTSYSSNDQESF